MRRAAAAARALPRAYVLRRPAFLLLIAAAAVAAGAKHRGWLDRPPPFDPSRFAGRAAAVTGVVWNAPDPRPSGCVYWVEVETVAVPGEAAASAPGRLLVHVMGSTVPVCGPGERIRAFGRVREPDPARSPGAFDYRAYLAARGVHAVVYAGAASFEPLGPSGRRRWAAAGWRLNRAVAAAFERRLPPERAAVLAGLTIGQRPRFHPELRRIFVESGTMHVLVASGSNVGFLLAGWLLVAAAARVPRNAALLSSLPVLWAYVVVVGGDAPIARAGTMATVGIAAHAAAREDRPVHALALAALAQIAFDPRCLFDVGFRMSFVTVLGLLHFMPAVEAVAGPRPFLMRWLLRALAAGVIAQLWLLPIAAGVFHRLHPWSLAANLAVVPLAAAGLGLGCALALAEAVAVEAVVRAVAAGASACAGALVGSARFFAELASPVWLPAPTPAGTAAFYAACLALPSVRRSWTARLTVAVAAAFIAASGVAPPPFAPKTWGAAWIDVGQRVSVVVRGPGREAVLVNPGPAAPADSAERAIAPFLAVNGVRALSAVVITDRRVTPADVDALRAQVPAGRVVFLSTAAVSAGGFRFIPLAAPAWMDERPVLIERGGAAVLLAHRLDLETQGAAMEARARVGAVQARFAPDAVWSPDFTRRVEPSVVVETAGAARPSRAPWRSAAFRRPHEEGWSVWEAP